MAVRLREGTDFIYKYYARNAWDVSNQIDNQAGT